MTVTDWFNKYKGQSLLVPGAAEADRGQCVQASDYWLNEGFGLAYVWANAKDWWNLPGSLAGNFDKITDGSVKAGDFVIYSGTLPNSGGYGHIDVAAGDGSKSNYSGYDSNWGGNKTLHQVTHAGNENQYILGSLRSKDMADKIDANASKQLQFSVLGRNGLAGRPYALDGSTGTPWVGGDLTLKFLDDIFNSPEATAYRDSKDAQDSIPGVNKRLASPGGNFVPYVAPQLFVEGPKK